MAVTIYLGIPGIALRRSAHAPRCVELIEYGEVEVMLPVLQESIRRGGRYPARLP